MKGRDPPFSQIPWSAPGIYLLWCYCAESLLNCASVQFSFHNLCVCRIFPRQTPCKTVWSYCLLVSQRIAPVAHIYRESFAGFVFPDHPPIRLGEHSHSEPPTFSDSHVFDYDSQAVVFLLVNGHFDFFGVGEGGGLRPIVLGIWTLDEILYIILKSLSWKLSNRTSMEAVWSFVTVIVYFDTVTMQRWCTDVIVWLNQRVLSRPTVSRRAFSVVACNPPMSECVNPLCMCVQGRVKECSNMFGQTL